MIKVGIVILNYRNPAMTIKCLDSLKAMINQEWEAVVVDNNSADGSCATIGQAHPWVMIIESPTNCGFALGNHLGYDHFKKRGVAYLWILNNDVKVAPDCLDLMLDAIRSDASAGVVGSKIVDGNDPKKVLAYGGGKISHLAGRSWHTTTLTQLDNLDFITGASMLVPMDILDRIGFIDGGFFLYYEDADFCAQLIREGLHLVVATRAVVYHYESSSVGHRSPSQCYYVNRSAVRFYARNSRFPLIPIVIGTALRVGKRVILGPWNEIPIVLHGARDGWRQRNEQMGAWGA